MSLHEFAGSCLATALAGRLLLPVVARLRASRRCGLLAGLRRVGCRFRLERLGLAGLPALRATCRRGLRRPLCRLGLERERRACGSGGSGRSSSWPSSRAESSTIPACVTGSTNFSLSTSAQMRNWRLLPTPSITGLAKSMIPLTRVLSCRRRRSTVISTGLPITSSARRRVGIDEALHAHLVEPTMCMIGSPAWTQSPTLLDDLDDLALERGVICRRSSSIGGRFELGLLCTSASGRRSIFLVERLLDLGHALARSWNLYFAQLGQR